MKSDVVNLIGRATANFLGASQLHAYAEAAPAARLSEYDRAYVRWSISGAEIASQLAAYLPDSSAERKWRYFSQNMRNTYLLLRDHPGRRAPALARGGAPLPAGRSPGDQRNPPPTLDGKRRNQTYEAALRRLLLEIEKKERLVVSVIVASPSSLQGSESPDP